VTELHEYLPELQRLKSRRLRNGGRLIDSEILQSSEFLNDPDVRDLAEIREKVGLLGGKLNPVELVTIDGVAAVKKRFLEIFGSDKEADFEFTYTNAKQKAEAALRDGLEAAYSEDYNLSEMSFDAILDFASIKIEELRERVRENRGSIRQSRDKNNPNTDILRTKLVASFAMQGVVEDLASTLQLVRGISMGDDGVMAEAIGAIYGRDIPLELKKAAEDYLQEMPNRVSDRYIGDGSSGISQDEFDALVMAEREKIPSTKEGLTKLGEMRAENNLKHLLYVDSSQIREAFEWIAGKLYDDYQTRTGNAFPEDQKFGFDISDDYSSIDVRDKSSGGKVVCIPTNRVTDLKSLYRLMIHEIESHVAQSLLSSVVVGLGGGMTKPNQETVYEGLALTRESEGTREFLGIEDKLVENRAFSIIAIEQALAGKGFWEVAHSIYDQAKDLLTKRGVSEERIEEQAKEKAWVIAYRIFRGHRQLDGSESGGYAFTKEGNYLYGSLLVDQMNKLDMGEMAGVAITHTKALPLLARFSFESDKMPIPYSRHADEYFKEFLQPRLKEYVESQDGV
jgi:hypothetical protein